MRQLFSLMVCSDFFCLFEKLITERRYCSPLEVNFKNEVCFLLHFFRSRWLKYLKTKCNEGCTASSSCHYQLCSFVLQKLASPSLLMLASLLAPYKRRWNTTAFLKITDGLYAKAWLKVRKLVSWAGAPRLGLDWLLGITKLKWNYAPPNPCWLVHFFPSLCPWQ